MSAVCPKCGGEMWDNRDRKANPKAPDFKCKDKNCEGVIWPPRPGGQAATGEFQKAKQVMQQPVVVTRPTLLDERQRAIIRQHSQSMAIELLKLKQLLSELVVEDLTPAKLRALADYFDGDVLRKTEHEEEF